MNRSWLSVLIVMVVSLSFSCLSPIALAQKKGEKRITVNGVTYENPIQFDDERYMTQQWMAQWPINHPWMDKNEDGKISPDEWERFLDKEYELIRKALELYEPREPHKGIPYRVMMPHNYDPAKSYPLILSLHGRGGNGNDNFKGMRVWNRWLLKDDWRERFPCFMLVPHLRNWALHGRNGFASHHFRTPGFLRRHRVLRGAFV